MGYKLHWKGETINCALGVDSENLRINGLTFIQSTLRHEVKNWNLKSTALLQQLTEKENGGQNPTQTWIFTETWLTEATDNTNLDGYSLIRLDRDRAKSTKLPENCASLSTASGQRTSRWMKRSCWPSHSDQTICLDNLTDIQDYVPGPKFARPSLFAWHFSIT